ncbi:MAG TPA: hypothetical protein PLX58_08080 [Smithellaceae bacterium]|jgi:hypothetical protein|nr:hypothetical protein [Smithellaceae bacterium]HQF84917.1 hypothetical protein [Smithellaceae bacterium]HQG81224.1 hypothetical protein [Smithellaceae bacterium]
MNRPYGVVYRQYAVKMVWHQDPFVQFDVVTDFGDFHPFIGDDFPRSQSVTV